MPVSLHPFQSAIVGNDALNNYLNYRAKLAVVLFTNYPSNSDDCSISIYF
ncbi:hypothetical protein [Acinetobacter bereziniae]|nr:hypothetical protein [Acinetobacter bereziniae]